LQNDCNGFNGFQKILLPLDDSEETRQKVNWVLKIAKGFDAEVLIGKTSKSHSDDTKKRLEVYAQQIETILNREGIRNDTIESFGQNVAESCIKMAQAEQCDLISIMTETENSNSFFMGTYAQQLVSTSPIPVMSIHARNIGKHGATGY
jgi:nucleotide-binding universal stress UspA family protein